MKRVNIFLLLTSVVTNALADSICGEIPISQWAGQASLRNKAVSAPVGLVVIQHTVTPEAFTDAECEDTVKSIRKYHMNVLHFDDIGQSFLVCGNGRVYEGAGWSHVGAHTKGYNTQALGIAFIGNFSAKLPSSNAITAAKDLLSCGVKNGHLSENFKVLGHRQLINTKSPGDALQSEIQTWPHWTNSFN